MPCQEQYAQLIDKLFAGESGVRQIIARGDNGGGDVVEMLAVRSQMGIEQVSQMLADCFAGIENKAALRHVGPGPVHD